MIYKKLFDFLFLVLFLSQVVSAANPAAVNLGYAGSFAILSKSGISTTGTTSIVGNIGVSPIDSTAMTGFGLILDSSGTFATSSLVTGNAYAADYIPPSPSFMTIAVSDMETAYTDAAGRTNPTATELGAGDISGMTITPGLYKWGTGVAINSGVTLDCQGNSSAVYIFQIAQDLAVANGAIVTLSGNCQANNIFWQVAGQATLGTTADFKGIILSKTLIGMNTGATLNGRALAQTAVTLDANAVTAPTESTPTPAPANNGGSTATPPTPTSSGSSNAGSGTTAQPATITQAQPTNTSTAHTNSNANTTRITPGRAIPPTGANRTRAITALAVGSTGANDNVLVLVVIGIIAILAASGAYYYFKVVKK